MTARALMKFALCLLNGFTASFFEPTHPLGFCRVDLIYFVINVVFSLQSVMSQCNTLTHLKLQSNYILFLFALINLSTPLFYSQLYIPLQFLPKPMQPVHFYWLLRPRCMALIEQYISTILHVLISFLTLLFLTHPLRVIEKFLLQYLCLIV